MTLNLQLNKFKYANSLYWITLHDNFLSNQISSSSYVWVFTFLFENSRPFTSFYNRKLFRSEFRMQAYSSTFYSRNANMCSYPCCEHYWGLELKRTILSLNNMQAWAGSFHIISILLLPLWRYEDEQVKLSSICLLFCFHFFYIFHIYFGEAFDNYYYYLRESLRSFLVLAFQVVSWLLLVFISL